MARWLRICQQCWQEQNPDDYCPELTDYARCNWCGEEALTGGVILRVIDQSAPTVLDEFDATSDAIDRLGNTVGFVGISKGEGMDSVAAIVGDLRRAVVRAS